MQCNTVILYLMLSQVQYHLINLPVFPCCAYLNLPGGPIISAIESSLSHANHYYGEQEFINLFSFMSDQFLALIDLSIK